MKVIGVIDAGVRGALQSFDKDEDGITFGDRTMIPRAWVRKIQKLV